MRGIAIVGVHGGMCGHARSAKKEIKEFISLVRWQWFQLMMREARMCCCCSCNNC